MPIVIKPLLANGYCEVGPDPIQRIVNDRRHRHENLSYEISTSD